jgi:long-chain acyl-CoA synthetase
MDVLKKYEELRNKTIPGLLLERAELAPQDVAYRAKKFGIYKECTWRTLSSTVTHCAMGLRRLGLKHGQRLALMGDPCDAYMICELAAQALALLSHFKKKNSIISALQIQALQARLTFFNQARLRLTGNCLYSTSSLS